MIEEELPAELLDLAIPDILDQILRDRLPLTKEHPSVEPVHLIFIKQAVVVINCQAKVNFQAVEAGIQELTKQGMKLDKLVEIFKQEEVDQDSIEKAPQPPINQLTNPEQQEPTQQPPQVQIISPPQDIDHPPLQAKHHPQARHHTQVRHHTQARQVKHHTVNQDRRHTQDRQKAVGHQGRHDMELKDINHMVVHIRQSQKNDG